MELKHTELLKSRLEEKLQSVKADRDEMVKSYSCFRCHVAVAQSSYNLLRTGTTVPFSVG